MYFLVANLLHQLPLEHNSSSTVTFSVLPRAGSLATGKELEWGNSTYSTRKKPNKILSDQEGENYDKEYKHIEEENAIPIPPPFEGKICPVHKLETQ